MEEPRAARGGGFSLTTRLLLMMLSLLMLSVSSLFVLHLYSEDQLVSKLRDYTEDLSTALEIVQEQPAAAEGADPTVVLQAYVEKLRQLGVKDVSMADASDEVQASTNPQNVGKRLVRSKKKGPREWVVRGVLGESGIRTQTTSVLAIPIVVGDRRVGNLLVTRYLDDFSRLSEEALLFRVAATSAVFAVGILLSLVLSWSFTRPVHELDDAARRVAEGDLDVRVPTRTRGGREIAGLARSFNEMLVRLREKQELEVRLHQAERSATVARLASGMAHEIRNPLNFISLSIDHLRSRLVPGEAPRKDDFDGILASMKAEISRLNRLVNDFLAYGKPLKLALRDCALADVVREAQFLVEPKARDQGVQVEVVLDPALPVLPADPELLKTCVLNLMINALDAMPKGGRITVSTRVAEEHVELAVRDTGHGMTPEEVESAFEPYFSTKDTGLGLGLAVTRKIVADHGGTISLKSALGQGTTALIVLPGVPAVALPADPLAQSLAS